MQLHKNTISNRERMCTQVPNYTAWRQMHTGVNNLPRVVAQPRPAEDRTRDLLIASPTPNTIAPLRARRFQGREDSRILRYKYATGTGSAENVQFLIPTSGGSAKQLL